MSPPVELPDLAIASGQTESPEVDFTRGIHAWVRSLTVASPDTLPETVTVQVTTKRSGGNFNPLQSGGADITLPAAKATSISPISFARMKLVAGAAVAAIRTFELSGREDDHG